MQGIEPRAMDATPARSRSPARRTPQGDGKGDVKGDGKGDGRSDGKGVPKGDVKCDGKGVPKGDGNDDDDWGPWTASGMGTGEGNGRS